MKRLAVLALVLAACGTDGGGEDPLFPADYAQTYQEVRNCRLSLEHDLMHIRVLVAPDALAAYTSRTMPFPTGATVLKEQYGEDDDTCSGPIVQYTVMQKLDVGSSPATLDWTWQRVTAKRSVTQHDDASCIHCHTDCGKPPEGYDGTCTMP